MKKQVASDKAIRQIDATRNPSHQQTEVVGQIMKQLEPAVSEPAVSVTEEQRLAEPVAKPTTASETAVGQLTKAFKTFSVNLLQQAKL